MYNIHISCHLIVLPVAVRSYNTLDYEFCVLTQKWSNQNTVYLYIILIGRFMTVNTILVLFMYYGG